MGAANVRASSLEQCDVSWISACGAPPHSHVYSATMIHQDRETKRQSHLAKADEAEKQATRSRDPETRASWERLAQQYRKLAEEM
jgi:hypothetical protein